MAKPSTRPKSRTDNVRRHRKKLNAKKRALREQKFCDASCKRGLTEIEGELVATDYVVENYRGCTMLLGFAEGRGFDQIWECKRFLADDVVLVVEAKGRNATLKDTKTKGMQMSSEWVQKTAEEMARSDDPARREIGLRVLEARKLERVVVQAGEWGHASTLPVPD